MEHASAGRLAREVVADRRWYCSVLPFLAHAMGKPDHRLFDLLHPAGIICDFIVRRADALLEALPAATQRSAFMDVPPAVGSGCVGGDLLAGERKSIVAPAGGSSPLASA